MRFVQVYYTRQQPALGHARRQRQAATASSARTATRPRRRCSRDLKQRGLLDDTLVVWGGEFGRTPYAEPQEKGKAGATITTPASRCCWPAAASRAASVIGATDEFGMNAVENRVHVHDLHATILHLMGLDHERLTYRYSGRDFRLTDVTASRARFVCIAVDGTLRADEGDCWENGRRAFGEPRCRGRRWRAEPVYARAACAVTRIGTD